MFRTNLRIAVRNLWKNGASSFINIFGLSVGLTSCLLIGLYVQQEASFDNFQVNGHRIARVIMEYGFNGSPETNRGNFTSTKVAPVFARTFPEVEASARMTSRARIVRYNDKLFTERYFLYSDSTFFTIFSHQLLQGNPQKALDGPGKMVITASAAKKYFGEENPVDKVLLVGVNETPFAITGVLADYPANSQLKFDFLASFSSMGVNQEQTYFEANYTTYLLLKDKNAFGPLQDKIAPFMKKEMEGSGAFINFILEPFDKIHLHSEFGGFVPNTSVTYLYILSGVALLILVIVCFTYINLSTARSMERAKEVGVRKVVGAKRQQLFWQFIGEAFLLFFISIVISIGSVTLVIPYFDLLSGQHLQLENLFSSSFVIFSMGITVVVSLLAGGYPAIVLSAFFPAKVLKGVFRNSATGKWVQQSLIVFQFGISVFLIIATLVVQGQLYFIQNEKLGYERDHVLSLPMNSKVYEKLAVLKQEFKLKTGVTSVSRCVSNPVQIGGGYTMRSSTMAESEQVGVTATPIDEEYIRTTGLEILAGSDLIEQDTRDVMNDDNAKNTYHFVLNESAASQLGWTAETAIGKRMFLGDRQGLVKAVVKDFHFQSMHQRIKPLVLFTEAADYGQLLVKISGKDVPPTIAALESTWKKLVPSIPFEYRFIDDDYDNLYRSELQLGTMMNVFSGIAILLACLGLFGLSAHTIQQRIKEIGIRKILGASLPSIVGLVSGSFVKLVGVSIVVACPIAFWMMNSWLNEFAYRIEIQWWMFLLAAFLSIGIALLTVSSLTLKASRMNLVKTLRSE
jgi:putative ABC transport system permease protein